MARPITVEDARVVAAVRSALPSIRSRDLVDFVRNHPAAQVQDLADAFLGGVVIEAFGPTRVAYRRLHSRLRRLRHQLGLPPPRKHSVARHRERAAVVSASDAIRTPPAP